MEEMSGRGGRWRKKGMSNVEPVSDTELLAALPGDVAAFEAFYSRHVDQVAAFAAKRCGTAADVADVVALTFVRLLDAAPRYEPERAARSLSSEETLRVPGGDEVLEGLLDIVGDVLGDGEALVRVGGDALCVADEHVDHAVGVADRLDVLVEGERA